MDVGVSAISDRVDRDRETHIAFVRALIAAARDGEAAVQAAIVDRLAAIGCEVQEIRYDPAAVPMVGEFAADRAMEPGERGTVVGRLKGTGGGRSLILFAHPDSEPIAHTDTWQRDPFAGVVEDGKLYGWGIADDLAGVAAMLSGLEVCLAAGGRPAGDVLIASAPSKRHARGTAAILHQGFIADAAVYLHPAESGVGMREIKAFTSGHLEFRVTVTGKRPPTTEPGLTAFYHLGVNPLDKAVVLYNALTALAAARGERIHDPRLDAAVGRSTNLMVSSIQCGTDSKFSRLAATCTFGGAVSFPPSERLEAVQAEIVAALETAAAADDWLSANPPVLEWVSGVTGGEIGVDHPLYGVACVAVEGVTGVAPFVNPMHSSSDIRVPRVQKGIPTIGFGPLAGDLSQNGCHDEWVDLDDYLRSLKVTAAIIQGWCGATATAPSS